MHLFLLGTGEYFEDGREIFDDDLFDDDEESKNSRKKPKSKKDKEDKKLKNEINKSGFQDLRNMLSSMPAKRKLVETDGPSTSKISEDELLSNLMEELHEDKKPKHNNSSSSKRFGTRLSIIPKREPKEMDDASINDLLEEMNRPLKKVLVLIILLYFRKQYFLIVRLILYRLKNQNVFMMTLMIQLIRVRQVIDIKMSGIMQIILSRLRLRVKHGISRID